MESTIDELIIESNNSYKLINYIPNELRFGSNRNISGNIIQTNPCHVVRCV